MPRGIPNKKKNVPLDPEELFSTLTESMHAGFNAMLAQINGSLADAYEKGRAVAAEEVIAVLTSDRVGTPKRKSAKKDASKQTGKARKSRRILGGHKEDVNWKKTEAFILKYKGDSRAVAYEGFKISHQTLRTALLKLNKTDQFRELCHATRVENGQPR